MNLPARTPHKIAGNLIALKITDDFKVEKFTDDLKGGGSIVKSGDLFIESTSSKDQYLTLKPAVQKAQYQQLPITNFI